MTSPLATLDGLIAPIIIAANKIRQVRDALPEPAWMIVPLPIRAPLDTLFAAVEAYDRKIGLLKAAGFSLDGVGTKEPTS